MLIKKIYIMKGVGTAKSVLKVSLLENGYSEIDLQTHFAYGDNYTFILKSGSFIHVEAMRSKGLKRKLQPFSLDGLCTGIAKDGKVIMWCADTPQVPYCLVELAQKYTTVKAKSLSDEQNRVSVNMQKAVVEVEPKVEPKIDARRNYFQETQSQTQQFVKSENETNNEVDGKNDISETDEVAILNEEPEIIDGESKDITKDFNILSIENDDVSTDDENDDGTYSMAKEIETKYLSYPHNETLENVFPESKWILTETDDLSLGLLYNSEKITHICYAKKGEKDSSFDHNATYYEGWWVVFTENE